MYADEDFFPMHSEHGEVEEEESGSEREESPRNRAAREEMLDTIEHLPEIMAAAAARDAAAQAALDAEPAQWIFSSGAVVRRQDHDLTYNGEWIGQYVEGMSPAAVEEMLEEYWECGCE
jgi:hypothetical protein